MKRVQQFSQGALWFIAVLASRIYVGLVIGLVIWAVLPLAVQWKPTVVMSGSMEPGIQVGDVLVAQPLTQEEVLGDQFIGPGSVLLAYDPAKPEQLVTHRVVERLPTNEFITRGDANPQNDSTPVPAENVVGLERLRIPYIGIPVQAMKVGDFVPALGFLAITAFANLVIIRDNSLQKAVSNREEDETLEDTPEDEPKVHSPIGHKVSSMLIIGASVIGISSVPSDSYSYAAYSDTTTNASNTITASSSFPVKCTVYLTTCILKL